MRAGARGDDLAFGGGKDAPLADLPGFSDAGPALGRDPFDDLSLPEPFEEQLERFELRRGARKSEPATRFERPPRADSARPQPLRPRSRRWATTPPLGEIDLPETRDLLDRLLGDHERRVLLSLSGLVEGDAPYDHYGFSPEVLKVAFPLFYSLYRYYFRVVSHGHENIPTEGPAILCANHGGLLPFDGAMGVIDVMLHTDPPRLTRSIVDKWAGTLPWVNVFFSRVGQVIGTRENFSDLLGDGQLLLCFPEGMDGIRKPYTQRYKLQNFRVGFVEQALRSGAPIVPMAFVGSDDQAPLIYDVKPLARRLGLPVAPITPTFPWLGPLGLLPYPVRYRIAYGKPLHFHARFGPEDAEDGRVVRYLANQVRRSVQQLVDELRA